MNGGPAPCLKLQTAKSRGRRLQFAKFACRSRPARPSASKVFNEKPVTIRAMARNIPPRSRTQPTRHHGSLTEKLRRIRTPRCLRLNRIDRCKYQRSQASLKCYWLSSCWILTGSSILGTNDLMNAFRNSVATVAQTCTSVLSKVPLMGILVANWSCG